jgi:hypothetical protein
MMTPMERRKIREVMKLLDQAYDALVKVARVQGQEPDPGMTNLSGWQSDDPTSDVRYWEGPSKRET